MERLCPANDNDANPPPPPRWDVYHAASPARLIGKVIAPSADEAIEAAAVAFRTEIKKLIAVRRHETG